MKFQCPYCNTKSVPLPEKNKRYQTCGNCGKRPRVVRVQTLDRLLIKYVRTAYKSALETKCIRVSGRITPSAQKRIVEKFGSVQKYLDKA